MSGEIVNLTEIEKSFGGVQVLSKVSLSVKEGEICCLAGENGCGKSTLIKIISGVYSHDGGQIALNGRTYPRLNPIDSIREGIQVIYQDFSLFPNLTVAENLALSDQVESGRAIVSWERMRRIAGESLAMIGIEMDPDKTVEELPVSGKQLVAIARAVYCNARLIIMDEPTTTLTQKEIDSLFTLIRNLKEKGISTLFVSHKIREMLDITEKITIMRNGRVVAGGDTGEFDEIKITQAMTGRDIGGERFHWSGVDEEPLLRTEKLSRRGAFSDIDLTVRSGEIVGITGLLGSGRTELALALFGRSPADGGKIFRSGMEVVIRSIQDAMENGIAYVPEDRLTEGLFLEQSIERNLFANTYKKFERFAGLLDFKKIRAAADKAMDDYGIVSPDIALPVRSLSGGNQQRVVLARWMSTGAEVLILNGPTVGVDVGSKFEIHKKLREIAERGVGILIFSDDIQELIMNCNRILVIHKGRFTDELQSDCLKEHDLIDRLNAYR
ncbi:MAG: sugar ABC transporter ATP-binding protein [Synergistaceae bacterium]|jgi:simple sugar transport system ATP-binding protein|nr:sugar ABC transporter ATP-binding protein [Synergistaceae bacterium]